jgi:excisionase family DNA binding protein
MSIDPLLPPIPLLAIPRLLEVSHVAHRLSASPEFVRRLLRDKQLTAIRLGNRWRVDEADLQKFIDAQRVDRRHADAPADRRIHLQTRADEAAG